MAGGDSQSRIKDATKYRVAGSRPGRARLWYSESTFSPAQVNAVLRAARSSAAMGEKFWIERFRNNRWEKVT